MNLATPSSVQKLQKALHDKAKESPKRRFHALYDKVYRRDVLAFAYACGKANGGAAGVDGQSFEDIEEYGVERWLDELAEELRSRTYRPRPVRRVWIPKPDGKQRPLGVPTIRDRTVETAAVVVLEPIFEADLQPEQYAYRQDRSALDAVMHVHKLVNTGYREIVDADLSGYFDSIPHAELLKSVARRVVDGAMLHLALVQIQGSAAFRRFVPFDWSVFGLHSQGRSPKFRQGCHAPSQLARLKLSLLDLLRQFHPADHHGCGSKTFKPQHRSQPVLHSPVVLFDQVVQILTTSHQHALRQLAARLQIGYRTVGGGIGVEGDLRRSPLLAHGFA
jgi:hypothetical protein